MTFACPVTKMLNLQVIETKSADGVVEGLSRLGCEQGFPKYLLLDQEAYCPIVVVRVTPSRARARESFMSMLMKLS